MLHLFKPSHQFILLATISVLITGCETSQVQQNSSVASQTNASSTLAAAPLLRQDAFNGIYEIVPSANGDSLFVATIGDDFDAQRGSNIHRLDARTLQVLQSVHVPRRSFALGLNRQTNTLYAGNTLDSSITIVDASSGITKGVIDLSLGHTRKVIVDEKHNRVFVTSPGRPGLIWIVDGSTNTLTHTITSDGIWSSGAAYDPTANRLYVGQGGTNELLVIDPDSGTIVKRLSTGETTEQSIKDKSANFFINIALDTGNQRIFAAGGQRNQIYVWDLSSGQVIKRIPFDASALDIVFNSMRNEIVTTHRGKGETGSGFVAILDATTYAIKQTFDLPVHPNSLALSPDGQTLYITVKGPRNDKHPTWRKDSKDSVVRIDLDKLLQD